MPVLTVRNRCGRDQAFGGSTRTPSLGHARPTHLHTMPLHDISEPHAYSHSISFRLMPSHAISSHLIPSHSIPSDSHHMSALIFLLARHSTPCRYPLQHSFFTREVPPRNANTPYPATNLLFVSIMYSATVFEGPSSSQIITDEEKSNRHASYLWSFAERRRCLVRSNFDLPQFRKMGAWRQHRKGHVHA